VSDRTSADQSDDGLTGELERFAAASVKSLPKPTKRRSNVSSRSSRCDSTGIVWPVKIATLKETPE